MRRREFVALLGGAATWPLGVHAQQTAMPVVGILNSASLGGYGNALTAFRRGLLEEGFAEGRNVVIEARWGDGQYDRLPGLAADLVASRVAVIFANGPAVLPAKAATSSIPIVFTTGFDPIQFGLVASLSHPGGNLTGVSILNTDLGPNGWSC